jgi:hypothetical protein
MVSPSRRREWNRAARLAFAFVVSWHLLVYAYAYQSMSVVVDPETKNLALYNSIVKPDGNRQITGSPRESR